MAKRWLESADGYDSIDEAQGIIRGVKVIGNSSKNRREYPDATLLEAKSKYEGVRVYIDHKREGGERSVRDKWGVLRDVRMAEGGGLQADLHYNREHSLTKFLLEDARRFKDTFGLSHSAAGDEKREGNRNIVTAITEVYSVDVVSDPATNRGLFESEGIVKRTVGQLLESNKARVKVAAILLEGLKKFKEAEGDGMEMAADPMAAPMDMPEESSPEDQVDAAFKAAIMAILDDEQLDTSGKLSKIRAVLGAQDKAKTAISGEGGGAPSEGGGEGEGDGEGEDKMAESVVKKLQAEVASLREENTRVKAEKACRGLLESAKREVTDVRMAALLRTPEGDRKALIESWPERKANLDEEPETRRRPARSPSKFAESTEGGDGVTEYPKTPEDFRKAVRG